MIVVLLGAATGVGASYATLQFAKRDAPAPKSDPAEPNFVSTGKILAPLVFANGELAGYVRVDAQLEVAADKMELVKARMPYLLHAMNMRTYRSPLASGPDGMLPDLAVLRTLLTASAAEAFGPAVVVRVAITEAVPA